LTSIHQVLLYVVASTYMVVSLTSPHLLSIGGLA